jgi:hypothetical protein
MGKIPMALKPAVRGSKPPLYEILNTIARREMEKMF